MGLLFANDCILCGRAIAADSGKNVQICPSCAAAVRREYRCTEETTVSGADGAAAALYYRGAVRNAMLRLKFHGATYCIDWFAAQTAAAFGGYAAEWQPDLITFMPIGWLHYRKRGFNQAEELAKLVAKQFSLPCVPTLRKRWFVRKQSAQKDWAARQENAKDAVLPKKGVDLSGKSVVLVDDIITSGATAAAAVKVLREMGAARVYVLAAAKTEGKQERKSR